MYIQLTTGCNMTCDHCCMSAVFGRGKMMSEAVFEATLNLANDRGEFVTLGGGEPTIHAKFFKFLDKAMALTGKNGCIEGNILVITNGKKTKSALKLYDMAVEQQLPVDVEVSQDYFHDPIDPVVVKLFTSQEKNRKQYGYYGYNQDAPTNHVGVRSGANETVFPVGRALKTGVYTTDDETECACQDLLIDPEGVIWSCGCKKVRLGTVFAPNLDNYDREFSHFGGIDPDAETN